MVAEDRNIHRLLTILRMGERALDKRKQLIEDYFAAVQAYSAAVRMLKDAKGWEFDKLYREAEQLREVSERCRGKLQESAQ